MTSTGKYICWGDPGEGVTPRRPRFGGQTTKSTARWREMRNVYIGTRTRHPRAPPGAQTYADRQQQVFGLHSGGRQRQHWWCNIAALESSFMRGMSGQAFFSLVSGQQCLPPFCWRI